LRRTEILRDRLVDEHGLEHVARLHEALALAQQRADVAFDLHSERGRRRLLAVGCFRVRRQSREGCVRLPELALFDRLQVRCHAAFCRGLRREGEHVGVARLGALERFLHGALRERAGVTLPDHLALGVDDRGRRVALDLESVPGLGARSDADRDAHLVHVGLD
jgi:hypothetical protein